MNIEKIILPDSIKSIGDNSSKNSSNLAKVSIGGEIFTLVTDVINRLKNKGVSVSATAFNGISKIHPSHGFTYTITKAATCTENGSKTGTCTCGNTDIQTISATGHSYGSWVTSSDGATKSRTCSKCGNKETISNKVDLKNASADVKAKYNFLGTTDSATQGSVSLGGGTDANGNSVTAYGRYIELGSTGTSRVNSDQILNECIIYLSKNVTITPYQSTINSITLKAGYYKLNALGTNWWVMASSASKNFLYIWTSSNSNGTPSAQYTYLGSTYSVVNAV